MTNLLQRRTFLKGLGTTLSLPLLDIMQPQPGILSAATAAGKPPVRTAFIFFPNGVIGPSWFPTSTGSGYEMPQSLKPLADLKSDINVISGLAQINARSLGDGPGDHARCASVYLTSVHPTKTSGADIKAGISVDQVAAQQVGHKTRLPSLELGLTRGRNAGQCDSGYSCAYSSNVSWRSPSTPTSKEIVPKLAFERLFGGGAEREKERARHLKDRQSILDLVKHDADQLKKQLGKNDKRKIDEYFTSVREIEQRIERSTQHEKIKPPEMRLPDGIPTELQEHARLMYDILLLAFQTDSTRIATFMVGNAGSNRTYPMVGVNSGHHALSHHRNDEKKIADIQKIDEYLISQFGYFLKRLKATPEGNSNLLDNSMICYGSAIGDGNRHTHHDLPIILAGKGGGTIKTGFHHQVKTETPLANLYLSMLDRMGTDVTAFGDSTGRLSIIDS
ncbi:DUF1552 domain-containing protein [Gimesia chilikensis]|uniref:DUF1552 domain-containing protein n=1 Tax=Gimesia chilikensis TaxID=2605989 RepID=UPI0011EE8923|nr:DUF1552 domain-containing protein [Gimesia chilikensis]KAA0135352.1 DUF1552 domain-containing protein [Gimesia chilikensis]